MKIRKPAVAGQFYPGDSLRLNMMLAELFGQAAAADVPEIHGSVRGIVAPHAGYVFSGLQAAKAYQCLSGSSYKTVCILSPSHREYFPAITLYSGDAYTTPLGTLEIDKKGRGIAAACPGIYQSEEGHRAEHALEVQLPFLQYVLNDFTIIPLVMGDQQESQIAAAAHCVKQLHEHFGRDILFVASTDLSHFHSASRAAAMDLPLIGLLEAYDIEGFASALQSHQAEACGGGPVLALLRGLGKEKHRVTAFGYSHSGQVLHDDREVVGYTSALVLEKGTDSEKGKKHGNNPL